MAYLHSIFNQAPEIALFLALAGGYGIGKFQFGTFQLGSVAGSLLVAVIISQVGIQIDNGIKSLLFALFIYAVGFESGPQFFRSLGRKSIRDGCHGGGTGCQWPAHRHCAGKALQPG